MLFYSEILITLEDIEIVISRQTVARRLADANLHRFRPVLTPLHSPRHLENRLTFSHLHKNATEKDLDLWIVSDEVKIEIFGRKDKKFVCRPVGESHNPKYTIPTVKHGGNSNCYVMQWKDSKISTKLVIFQVGQ